MCLYPKKNDSDDPRVMAATGRITAAGAYINVPVEALLDDVCSGTAWKAAIPEARRFADKRGCQIDSRGIGEVTKVFYDTELNEHALVVYKFKVVYPSHEKLEMDYPLGVF